MTEWKEYKLGDVLAVRYGKDHKPLGNGQYPVYGSGGIMRYADKFLYDKESILIPRKGSLNNIFYQDKAFWTVDTMFWSEIDSIKVFPKFLYYQLILVDFENLNVGSAVPSLTIPIINDVDITLPSLEEQRKIAGVLSSLDDKIDLLNRENATLEALAETLFRHYFIETPHPTWKEGKLTDLIKIVGGGTPKTSKPSYWGGNIGWLSGGDIAAGHKCYVYHVEKYITQKGVNNSAVNIIPEDSMVISARGTVGKYCLLGKPMAFSQSNYGILPKINECYYFSYLLVSRYVEEMKNAAYGSVFDTITVKTFEGINVTIPNDKEIVVFNTMVKPIFEKIKSNQKQILALTSQRDTLLPRLMSGEVKVGEY